MGRGRAAARRPLELADYVVFDLETTGTRAGVSRIVELGAVRMSGLSEAARMQRLVDPGCMVPAQITQITGIAQHHVRGRPRVGPVLDEFLRFSAGAVLVAHNARFDIGFVDADLARLRSGRLAAPVIDTVALARRLLGDRLERMNLGSLAERFDTEVRPCHRALPDALATAEVLVRLLGLAQERGAATVADVIGLCAPQHRRVAPGAASPRACRPARASTCSATPATRCSTSARRPTCAPASARTSRAARCGRRSNGRSRPRPASRPGRSARNSRRRCSSSS